MNNEHLMLKHTVVNNVSTTKVDHRHRSWEAVRNTVTQFKTVATRENEQLFTGWEMKPHNQAVHSNGHYSRCKANVVAVSFLTLDIDNQEVKGLPYMVYDEALETFSDMECALYTSFNHLNPNKDATSTHPNGVDKFRVVIPLNRKVMKADFEARIPALKMLFPSAAEESFRLSQPFYQALQHPDRIANSRADHIAGNLLDIMELEPITVGEAKEQSNLPQFKGSTTDYATSEDSKTIYIKRASDKVEQSAYDWWNTIQDGYSNRVPCFSILRSEANATSFFYKDGDFIIFYDMGRKERMAIRVRQFQKISKGEMTNALLKFVKKGAAK